MTRKKSRQVCPKLYFDCSEFVPGYRSCRAYTETDNMVGEMDLEVDNKAKLLKVGLIEVEPNMQRCGIGTRLYEKALDHACELGLKLSSDTARTDTSEGFWRKQVRKRRARCAEAGEGAERLNARYRPDGRWECRRYEIKASCPASRSLAGRKKRRK